MGWVGPVPEKGVGRRKPVTFLFGATEWLICESEEDGECRAPAIEVTITNIGSKVLALDQISVEFRTAYGKDKPKSRTLKLRQAKAAIGEPLHAWIELLDTPTAIESVVVRNTTGEEWTPNRRELRHLRKAGAVAWKWESKR